MGAAFTGPKRPLLPDEPCRQCGGTERWKNGRCRGCRLRQRNAWAFANPEQHLAHKRRDHERHREIRIAHSRRSNRKLKADAMAAYGGCCYCCGEDRLAFLTIDHAHNDGKAHRLEIGLARIYRWLKVNGYPQDGRFRCACWNCNAARQYFGECPHETERRTRTVA